MMPTKKTPPATSSTPDRSQADPATAYALDVVSGAIVAGPHVRDACKRHLADLEAGPRRGLLWSPESAQRALDFFSQVLKFPDGDRAGQPFHPEPWQAFVVGSIFGWLRADDGLRRFRTCYLETGKGSGKSPLGAGMGLYLLTADKQQGAECYCAAVTRDQAQIAFRDAVRMVDASPALSSRLQKSGSRQVFNLAVTSGFTRGSFFRPISSEGRALDGKRVHFALLDEVHEHPSALVVDKITAGIKALRQPLIAEITNSGYDRSSVCWSHHQYSVKVASGALQDDEWFGYVCALDEGDRPLEDESCWIKANPSLGVTIRHDYLRKQVREARGMPAKESIVLRLNFCVWTDAANPWIDGELWRQCETAFDLDEVEGVPCWAGLDLSGKNDLTACCLVWRMTDGKYRAASWFWTPKDTLDERGRRDGVPYGVWADDGVLEAPPGRAINLQFVAMKLAELSARFSIQAIAFDPYHIEYLRQAADEVGAELNLIPHGQGYAKTAKSNLYMPRSIELLEQAVFEGAIQILPSPVLSWNSASAVLEADAKGNRIFQKRKSTGRIDGLVALSMAMGCANEDDGGADLEAWLKSFNEAA
jgi:phage terminase large subunit-like protein